MDSVNTNYSFYTVSRSDLLAECLKQRKQLSLHAGHILVATMLPKSTPTQLLHCGAPLPPELSVNHAALNFAAP